MTEPDPNLTTTTTTTTVPRPTHQPPPQRQIRALHDARTITVYQAYPSAIASAAVAAQRLSASPAFKPSRTTWIKPSWCWMMYRSGYSFKDARQERVLALRVARDGFAEMLRGAVLTTTHQVSEGRVRVQWDPERGPALERRAWRSLQVGIPPGLVGRWVDEWVVGIEDVTDRARELKRVVEAEPGVGEAELRGRGLLPEERVYEVPADVRAVLGMDG
ncbi:hypothetical protein SLS58_004464 [Diplodia intermedia]|uniref:ATP-dependent RNA helicase DHX8 n=1 Tax=Diplodia intermedia TaxID=856260 RepID=A0ABR3TTG5_9PEZI